MYKGFNFEDVTEFSFKNSFNKYKVKGETLMNQLSSQIESDIKSIVLKNSVLDGNMIMGKWFKQVDADIFISHSHDDLPLALALSGYLNEQLGLKCFVDSLIWGEADKLLKIIDNKYSFNDPPNGCYSYKKRNYSTSHVHNMLLMSITHMIDKTDCLFFLNTQNAVPLEDGIKEQTLSPWIYSEIEISRVIRKELNKKNEINNASKSGKTIKEPLDESISLEFFSIRYPLNIDHLLPITLEYVDKVVHINGLTPKDPYSFLDFLYKKHTYKIK